MSRGLTSDFLAELSASSLKPFYAINAEFQEGDIKLWTGYGDITINSETYTGSGSFLNISGVEETAEIKATSLSIALSGVDSSILTAAINANYQNRTLTLYLGMLNESYGVIADVYQFFQGRMDTMTINDAGENSSITLTVESRLIDLEKPNEKRYTNEDQKTLFSTDKGLEFVTDLQDKEIVWGKESK
jgi:hypothetical protein